MTKQFKDSPKNMSPTERAIFGTLGASLILAGRRQSGVVGAALGLVGAAFAAGAAMGKSPYNAAVNIRRTPENGIHVRKTITILRPVGEVYGFWRKLENLPRFMNHLESVTQRDERISHWVAKAPAGMNVEWDAEIITDEPDRLIAWRAVEGSSIPNEGQVEFREAPGDRGTEVHVDLQYHPPGGTFGAGVARWFGEEPGQQIEEDLRRLKRLMEVGFEPTTEGQPSGRKTGAVERVMTGAFGTGSEHATHKETPLTNKADLAPNTAQGTAGTSGALSGGVGADDAGTGGRHQS